MLYVRIEMAFLGIVLHLLAQFMWGLNSALRVLSTINNNHTTSTNHFLTVIDFQNVFLLFAKLKNLMILSMIFQVVKYLNLRN